MGGGGVWAKSRTEFNNGRRADASSAENSDSCDTHGRMGVCVVCYARQQPRESDHTQFV